MQASVASIVRASARRGCISKIRRTSDRITIAGGTGLVGKHLTHALLREGAQVRVLTRDPQKAKAAFGEGKVEIAGVDFDDSKTLRDAFKGSDRAFLSMGASDRQVHDEIALIDAATDAGVPFLVNLSIGGAGRGIPTNVLEWHSEIDAHVTTKDVISTLVRPATYTDTVVGVAANFVPSGQWGGVAGTGRVRPGSDCMPSRRPPSSI